MVSRLAITALIGIELLCGCQRSESHPASAVIVPERIASNEILMTATLGSDPRAGATLEITLRNVGQRSLLFDTGIAGYPMANFAFNLQLPDRTWLQLFCHLCMPGSFSQPSPYTVRLSPSQFLHFTLPLSTFVAADPSTGDAISLQALHGRILIELQVPTPPGAPKPWPGYVQASVALP